MEGYLKMLTDSAIRSGDILDVSSDLRKIILYCRRHGETFDANKVLDTLQDIVGSEGTLLVRVWNWEFCHGTPFDYRTTPSRVGALGNTALKRTDFIRSQHPLYSFCVWGKYQQEIIRMTNKSAWGSDSPFAFLTSHNGRQLMYGSNMYNSLTYVHYVEEQTGVHYRYLKDFTGQYIDKDGNCETRTYSMNVRDLDLDIRMFNEDTAMYFPETFEEIFSNKGILHKNTYDDVFVGVVDLAEAYPIIQDDILNNRSRKICLYEGQNNQ